MQVSREDSDVTSKIGYYCFIYVHVNYLLLFLKLFLKLQFYFIFNSSSHTNVI